MTEIWKDIQGFEGFYQVSDCGRVRGVDRNVLRSSDGATRLAKGKVLKPKIDKDGYNVAQLYKENCKHTRRYARLIGEAFIPNPHNKPEINHKDGDRGHDLIGNLEWATISENRVHSFQILGRKVGTERPVQALNTKGEVLYFDSVKAAEREGFIRSGIYANLKGESSHHRGFIWSYLNG